MSGTIPEENRLYRSAADLPWALWDDLEARDPLEAARACGAQWDESAYTIRFLARDYRVEPGARLIQRVDRPQAELSFQTGMILVCALGGALEVPPSGAMVTPQELPGGAMFFAGPHALATPALEERYGRRLAALKAAGESMQAEMIQGADMAFKLYGLPRIPLYLLFWQADEEFEARAVIGIDSNSKHHLALDGIWALTNCLVEHLLEADPAR